MSSRRMRRPPSLNFSISSSEPSPPHTANSSDLELDSCSTNSDERPLSRAASHCSKMPTLSEVLSNTAPPPYTLSAFMAYLSQNHCLETLEFTMDASRYRKHFTLLGGQEEFNGNGEACEFVRSLWQRLLDAYIAPNGPREVNLPCGIRDCLLSVPNFKTPPSPETLDVAVAKVYELMEESVLIPFINSCHCPTPYSQNSWAASQSDDHVYMRGSLDERVLHRNTHSGSPPPGIEFISHSYTAPVTSSRHHKTHSPFSVSLGWSRNSSHGSPNSWSSSPDAMMDDYPGTGASSRCRTPVTPPATPPLCEERGSGSPKPWGGREKGWRRVTTKLSWKKASKEASHHELDTGYHHHH